LHNLKRRAPGIAGRALWSNKDSAMYEQFSKWEWLALAVILGVIWAW
jgi:hypothetical protein